MPTPPPAPVSTAPAERQLAPDLARGAMLCLIAMAYAGVYAGAAFGTPATETAPLDTAARLATVLLLDNRAFAMFAILFGYGMAWLVQRHLDRGTDPRQARRLLRRRGLYLIVFGCVHALLVFPGEILASYGLATLVLGFLLFRPARALARTAVLLTPVYAVTVTLAMLGYAYAAEQDADQWSGVSGYTSTDDWAERLAALPAVPLFIALAYPLLLLVVLGMRAGRRRLLHDPAAHRGLLVRIALVGVGVSVLGALPAALATVGAVQAGPTTMGLFMAAQNLTAVFGGAGYLALFGLLGIGWKRRGLVGAVAALGQRSLTFYLFNSVALALVLHPELIGLGTRVGAFGALVVAAAVWGVGVALASMMAAAGRAGPMEVLLRRLVYGPRP